VERSRCTGLSDTVPDMDVVLPFDGLVHAVNVTTAALTTNAHVADSPAESGSAVDGLLIMLEDLSHEKRMRNTMARYMSPEIVDKLMNDGEGALGGSSLDVTCMFTDIRSFTSVSEKIGPEETVKLLNSYFSIMVDIVMESGGILDKFIGDALFAVFGAPYPSVDDADRAVQAGVAMLRACHVFNQERVAEGKDPVLMGVGVNTGPVISGNIGSQKRMDYTVIGDAVNLASRLEGANKQYGTEFLISQSTLDLLKGSYLVRDVDVIVVKGKSEGVKIYQVLDYFTPEEFPNRDRVIETFQRGIKKYRGGAFSDAKVDFRQCLALHSKDALSRMYCERCDFLIENPPEGDWNAAFVMTTK